ncbi:MAG: hypothetical protein JSS81_29235 [Acidobacteria bacterium]|nr:hypothetical protein [Acidobacteriota bacterium]
MPNKSENVVLSSLKRLGRPLIFVVVTLTATLAMLFLYAVRADFVEKLNYPIVVVGSDYGDGGTKSYQLKAGNLAARIAGSDICANLDDSKSEMLNSVGTIVCRSVEDVKYRNFRNEGELLAALQESASAQRTAQLKYGQAGLEQIEKNRYDFDLEKKKALEILNARISEPEKSASTGTETPSVDAPADTLSRARIEKLLALYTLPPAAAKKAVDGAEKPKGPDFAGECGETIRGALAGSLKKLNGDSLEKTALNEQVEAAFREREKTRLADAARLRTQMEQTGGLYDKATEKFYALKQERLKPAANPLAFLFFADDGGLFVVYKLVMLTLTAIVVFSLLFLILVPLRKIFFLDPAADAMIDKARGVIDLRNPRIDFGGTAGSLLATVATVGIGVAAIAATPFPGGPESVQNDSQDRSEISKNYGDVLRSKYGPKREKNAADTDDTQVNVNELAANVLALDQSVAYLDRRISNWEPVIVNNGGPPPDLEGVRKSIADLNGNLNTLMTRTPFRDPDIATMNKTVNDLGTLINKINGQVGNSTSLPNRSLFGNLEGLDTKTELLKTTLGDSSRPATVLGKLETATTDTGNLSDVVGVDSYLQKNTTLFDDAKLLKTTTDKIDQKNSEAGLYVSGGPGSNIIRQFRTLFSKQRYAVTSFAVAELMKYNARLNDAELANLIVLLDNSLDDLRLRAVTPDDLFEQLKKTSQKNGMPTINEAAWKKWKKTILQSTRVSRR